jgi:hypothetical protein
MLHSSNSLPPKKKDAFSSVAIAVCLDGQICAKNHSFDHIQAALECIIAITIASSTGLVVISDHQIAH